MKTGVQWRFLPVQCFFSSKSLTWQGVYYHFREWIKDGSWTQVWLNLLLQHRRDLDLSCVQKEIIANIPHNPRNEKETESTNCQYFDEALYKRRYVIERANAWQDQFKALIIRYESRVDTWLNLLILSFTVIFIRRINKKNKS